MVREKATRIRKLQCCGRSLFDPWNKHPGSATLEKWFEYLEEYIIFFLIFEESGHQLIRKIFDLYVDSAPSGLN